MLISNKETRAFKAQRDRAINRGIAFNFTLLEWIAWWRENLPDGTMRGLRRDQYVMARRGDQGAYEPGNVIALTPAENYADRSTESRRRGVERLNAERIKLNAAHLRDREHHPRARAVITPKGQFASATLAGEHFGITKQAAAARARGKYRGWRFFD